MKKLLMRLNPRFPELRGAANPNQARLSLSLSNTKPWFNKECDRKRNFKTNAKRFIKDTGSEKIGGSALRNIGKLLEMNLVYTSIEDKLRKLKQSDPKSF